MTDAIACPPATRLSSCVRGVFAMARAFSVFGSAEAARGGGAGGAARQYAAAVRGARRRPALVRRDLLRHGRAAAKGDAAVGSVGGGGGRVGAVDAACGGRVQVRAFLWTATMETTTTTTTTTNHNKPRRDKKDRVRQWGPKKQQEYAGYAIRRRPSASPSPRQASVVSLPTPGARVLCVAI